MEYFVKATLAINGLNRATVSSFLYLTYSIKIKMVRVKESLRRNRIAHLLPIVPFPIPYPCRRLLRSLKWPGIESRSFSPCEIDSLIPPIRPRIKYRTIFYCKGRQVKKKTFVFTSCSYLVKNNIIKQYLN